MILLKQAIQLIKSFHTQSLPQPHEVYIIKPSLQMKAWRLREVNWHLEVTGTRSSWWGWDQILALCAALSTVLSPSWLSWCVPIPFQLHLEENLGSQVNRFLWSVHELLYYFLSIKVCWIAFRKHREPCNKFSFSEQREPMTWNWKMFLRSS